MSPATARSSLLVWLLLLACVSFTVSFSTRTAFQQSTATTVERRKEQVGRRRHAPSSRPILLRSSISSSSTTTSSSSDLFKSDSESFLSSSSSRRSSSAGQLQKDVLVIGGGLAGFSAALYLSQIDPSRRITIVDVGVSSDGNSNRAMASSLAAAGMLAPHSERLPKGDYLDLCMSSKNEFRDFCHLVETMAQDAASSNFGDAKKFLVDDDEGSEASAGSDSSGNGNTLKPWNVGYVAAGGFLAPAFAGDNVATWAPPTASDADSSSAMWLDATQVRELEPYLHPDVVGGWWFPEDASVDARRLLASLKAACVGSAGVEYLCDGSTYEVSSLDLQDGKAHGVWLKNSGKYIAANDILVANGAWMRTLLPVPLEPHKGQSLSLKMPKGRPPILRRVLFAQDSYIVPKADGRIVIGATVEAGSYDPNVTPAGIMHILHHALELIPGLAELPLEETWAGLRPTTPDKGPILGTTPWKGLYLAGGYWRNGVLLAPKTGQMMAALIAGKVDQLSERDQELLKAFNWDRFTSPEGAKKLAANTRYAASMYPVHTRRSGVGVAAAVGTELGSYSTARSAGDERKRDREAMFKKTFSDDADDDDLEESFERAAQMGQQDAAAFEQFKPSVVRRQEQKKEDEEVDLKDIMPQPIQNVIPPALESSVATVPYDGDADALTVGTASFTEGSPDKSPDLESIYKNIRENKAKAKVDLPEDKGEQKPDPGYRIYHVDEETGEETEVPPYTRPGVFLASLKSKQSNQASSSSSSEHINAEQVNGATATSNGSSAPLPDGPSCTKQDEYDETTYDGYQVILNANSSTNREDELRAMKEARRKNRLGESDDFVTGRHE
eukprot:CAMPEP_0113455770 /NCGR_PEP_ID=MMETSP0014_2-20120614/8544_1 /TAXON_ID=2857 /ORGANISM="Nitzschia sp." /LENGTH=841 /DNA_ID=CAMNT_0000347205 /DNA_START=88 /DNA_END=2613 /DNA_ORIENTATION=- /assembly_acc=CAM_ASM_000159